MRTSNNHKGPVVQTRPQIVLARGRVSQLDSEQRGSLVSNLRAMFGPPETGNLLSCLNADSNLVAGLLSRACPEPKTGFRSRSRPRRLLRVRVGAAKGGRGLWCSAKGPMTRRRPVQDSFAAGVPGVH